MRLNFESLVYDLPEDVLRAELAGDFDRERRLIERRLADARLSDGMFSTKSHLFSPANISISVVRNARNQAGKNARSARSASATLPRRNSTVWKTTAAWIPSI